MMGPGIPKGERRDTFCYLIDIYPTLCQMAGLDVPESVEGKSLVSVLTSRSPSTIYSSLAFAYKDVQRSVMADRYKLIEYVVEGKRHTQLFDHAKDPFEITNLATETGYKSKISEMRQLLRQWRDKIDDNETSFWEGFHDE